MKRITLLILTLLSIPAYAQMTIEECQRIAKENYPQIKQYELINKAENYSLSNAGKGYLPQLNVLAQGSYQTDVAQLPVDIPGLDIKSMNKDQYMAEIQLSQVIWDGGAISNQKKLAKATANARKKDLDAQLYQIRNRVNELYFGILLFNAQLEQNRFFDEDLQRSLEQIESRMTQGVANQSDLDIVKVEILNNKQNRSVLIANRRAFLDMLSQFIIMPLYESTSFQYPDYEQLSSKENRRPELASYEARIKELAIQKQNIKVAQMPKLELFARGGYGRPGLNMLKSKFDTYAIAGLRMVWNISSLYTKGNDEKLIEINQGAIHLERETFLFNTELALKQEDNIINKNRELLKHDNEIVRLRISVRKAAEAKLLNGVISATDYMREMTAEDLAKQQKIVHEIELLHTIYTHKFISNN